MQALVEVRASLKHESMATPCNLEFIHSSCSHRMDAIMRSYGISPSFAVCCHVGHAQSSNWAQQL